MSGSVPVSKARATRGHGSGFVSTHSSRFSVSRALISRRRLRAPRRALWTCPGNWMLCSLSKNPGRGEHQAVSRRRPPTLSLRNGVAPHDKASAPFGLRHASRDLCIKCVECEPCRLWTATVVDYLATLHLSCFGPLVKIRFQKHCPFRADNGDPARHTRILSLFGFRLGQLPLRMRFPARLTRRLAKETFDEFYVPLPLRLKAHLADLVMTSTLGPRFSAS